MRLSIHSGGDSFPGRRSPKTALTSASCSYTKYITDWEEKHPTLARSVRGGFNGARGIRMALKAEFRKSTTLAAAMALLAAVFLTVTSATPARADRCDDIANQLKNQIDGLKVGITAANVIYLSHPLAKELSLGCANRKYSNELYAKADSRKPKPEFVELVASAAAIVFTLPKDYMLKGASRCFSQMGIFRGDDVNIRYRRLDMNCTRTRAESAIAIQRGKDQ
jgi:hypothetical protein